MRALLGVSDRTGLVELARGLSHQGVELVATDGTRRALLDAGIEATSVSHLTGLPEMLDGRVKTLHPAIHAGILARRDRPEHMAQLGSRGFLPIDIVVVSLYPFAEAVARGAEFEETVENIDIGGPTMIRAAAKNHDSVAVVVRHEQYPLLLEELARDGCVSASTRRRLAAEAFALTAAYDTAVAGWFRQETAASGVAPVYSVGGPLLHELRYGENPHQHGALYAVPGVPGGVANATQVQGGPLSFTNWLDVDAACRLVCDVDEPAAAVIKHTNPCGVAVAEDISAAYARAYDCDPRAAYGGIVGLNRRLDLATARLLSRTFLEAVICRGLDDDAAELLRARERLRVLTLGGPSCAGDLDVRSIDGGLLVQSQDWVATSRGEMRVATSRQPDDAQWRDLLLAWRVCRHVKSNAVVIVRDG
ncbi:MAG: bifunctional phosphoribosylaminoimidazolecarboxamide formyltransferase/IMP cyclohydrolase, partial [Candidatus Dormibacteria bacterium]